MNEPYVFISYSRKDLAFVENLGKSLRSKGIRTWIDLENIPAGSNWKNGIELGIRTVALIYVSSKNSNNSEWMKKEIFMFTRERGKLVIPVIIDDEGADRLPSPLRNIQWVDFRYNQFEKSMTSLIESLVEHIPHIQSPYVIKIHSKKSKGYVFISYADEDLIFVEELKTFLENKGYAYWNYRDNPRNYLIDFTLELESIIKEAFATISIISPNWKRSYIALQELHFSKAVEKPIFLLILIKPGPTLALSGMNFIDFTQNHQAGFLKLDKEMRSNGL